MIIMDRIDDGWYRVEIYAGNELRRTRLFTEHGAALRFAESRRGHGDAIILGNQTAVPSRPGRSPA
jgi:hypothetical protein